MTTRNLTKDVRNLSEKKIPPHIDKDDKTGNPFRDALRNIFYTLKKY